MAYRIAPRTRRRSARRRRGVDAAGDDLAERGIDNCIMCRPNKHHPLLAPGDQARNARLAHVLGRVETIFLKRVHRHTRLRYFSLRRNLGQMMLLAFAMNIKRAAALTE